MLKINNKYFVKKNATIRAVLSLLNISPHQCLLVINNNKKLLGTITDGDIRKSILKNHNLDRSINEIYNKHPIKVYKHEINEQQIKKNFKINKFSIIPVVDIKEIVVGLYSWDYFFEIQKNQSSIHNLNIIIMAGGRGLRFAPFSNKFPKALMPIGDKPMINRIIEKYHIYGFNYFYISIFYQKRILKSSLNNYFKDNPNLQINYINEDRPLGTIGAVANINYNKYSDPVIITNCDTIISDNIEKVVNTHIINKYDITLFITEKFFENPYGEVIINNKKFLTGIKEKPKLNFLVNVGFYIISKKALKLIPKNKFFDATDLILKAKSKYMKVMTHEISSNNWIEIGKMKELEAFNDIIKN